MRSTMGSSSDQPNAFCRLPVKSPFTTRSNSPRTALDTFSKADGPLSAIHWNAFWILGTFASTALVAASTPFCINGNSGNTASAMPVEKVSFRVDSIPPRVFDWASIMPANRSRPFPDSSAFIIASSSVLPSFPVCASFATSCWLLPVAFANSS